MIENCDNSIKLSKRQREWDCKCWLVLVLVLLLREEKISNKISHFYSHLHIFPKKQRVGERKKKQHIQQQKRWIEWEREQIGLYYKLFVMCYRWRLSLTTPGVNELVWIVFTFFTVFFFCSSSFSFPPN